MYVCLCAYRHIAYLHMTHMPSNANRIYMPRPHTATLLGLYMERVVKTDADAGKGPGTLPPFGSGRLGVRGGLSIVFCAKHGSNACRLQYRQQQEMLNSTPLPGLPPTKGVGRPPRETSDSTGELESVVVVAVAMLWL